MAVQVFNPPIRFQEIAYTLSAGDVVELEPLESKIVRTKAKDWGYTRVYSHTADRWIFILPGILGDLGDNPDKWMNMETEYFLVHKLWRVGEAIHEQFKQQEKVLSFVEVSHEF